jgi:uncharacterized protein (TIGR03435 family)
MTGFVAYNLGRSNRLAFGILIFSTLTITPLAQTNAGTVASPPKAEPPGALPALEFDVVSIKQSKNNDAPMRHAFPPDGDSMTFTNTPLSMIILFLFNSDHPGLTRGLPDWTKTERYDITAKVTGPEVSQYQKLTLAQRKMMLQRVLADRFKLQIHGETMAIPVYDLVLSRSGSKMSRAEAEDVPANGRVVFFTGRGQLTGKGAKMADLAFALSDIGLGREVHDLTGLTGRYNFTLQFTPDQDAAPMSESGGQPQNASSPDALGPTLFTAIQEQLGLRLQSDKAPVESLVIDHIEKPSEN